MSEPKSINKVDMFGNAVNIAFNLVWPIGVTYPQYPGEKSPMDLWGEFSTWEPINYNGAFFRAAGGNANPWIEVTTTNGRNFTIKEGRTVPLNSALKYGATVTFNGESRTVNNVVGSGSNITSFSVNSAFTEPSGGYKNITNVYILQGSQNKSHHHPVYVKDTGHSHALNYPDNVVIVNRSGNSVYYGPIAGFQTVTLSVVSDKANIVVNGDNSQVNTNATADSGEDEARPSNSTYIIWRRTA